MHIGLEPPTRPDSDAVIESIGILYHKGWFATDHVPLSPFLNAIVGEKGTGKTAFADLIAYATGSWTEYDGSFLHKAWNELKGSRVVVKWASGRESSRIVGNSVDPEVSGTRYLSQQFVERLCSGDIMAEDLLREVERVIFGYLPEPDRMNCSAFHELRAKVTADISAERRELKRAILEVNQEIEEFQKTLSTITEKKRNLQKLRAETATRQRDLNELSQ